ncbi:DUF924 family protein [Aerococcus kribbianus]|uniref:DUF924 domain-containing protein n=1 Tax=Aerococcus kribbianus TaxID=2999064 RepID=A0A9X3FU29_9LACT|nr:MULTISPECIES: DUF924 family protein [unclassified Aerococcus]MCZ0716876.1 DUF924 domain-containing protein [Aerococcus sp. YH-aer221]MCZ0725164.1 DUF924 domain-containing protein [Aerococcus sp. YH-aer222]
MTRVKSQDILDFWFHELDENQHFIKDPSLDQEISDRFLITLQAAKAGELWEWRHDIFGCLAEIILLDQFSRNIYRDQAQAFSSDDMALVLAQSAYLKPDYQTLDKKQQHFLCMPFMHSESLIIHEKWAYPIFKAEFPESLSFEEAHKAQIERFGRYPFRNAALGRQSTTEELDFMANNDAF